MFSIALPSKHVELTLWETREWHAAQDRAREANFERERKEAEARQPQGDGCGPWLLAIIIICLLIGCLS